MIEIFVETKTLKFERLLARKLKDRRSLHKALHVKKMTLLFTFSKARS